MTNLTRRRFLGNAGLAAAAAAVSSVPVLGSELRRPLGANNRLRVAVVGVRGRGDAHLGYFLKFADVEVAAICDVDPGSAAGAMDKIEKVNGKKPLFFQDARKLMEDKTIDAVSVATTNHTHSLIGMWALAAGKHVYIEKPMSHNVAEGRKVVELQQKSGKVVQHGTQCRSMKGMRDAMQYLHDGKLGKIKIVRGFCYKQRKSINKMADGAPPAGVDYNLWLGPAPERPFSKNRFHYNWHWHWDYGNGDLGNQGVHQMDIARWGINKTELPKEVTSVGGRLGYEDDGETPNTQVGVCDYGDVQIIFEVRGLDTDPYKLNGDKAADVKVGDIFEGTEGTMVVPTYSSALVYDPKGKMVTRFGGGDDSAHFRNFIDAVKTNKPEAVNATALDGHLSSALCHLVNISHRVGAPKPLTATEAFGKNEAGNETFGRFKEHLKENGLDLAKTSYVQGRPIKIDPKVEAIVDDPDASKLLQREYRKGFELPK